MKMHRATLFILTATILATSICLRQSGFTNAAGQPTVRFISEITELRSDIPINQTFKVALVVEEVSSLYGFDFQLNWTTDYIQYVSHTVTIPVDSYSTPQTPSPYEGILKNPILPVKNVINENKSIPGGAWPDAMAWFAYSSYYPAPSFNGSGTVVVFTFKVIEKPSLGANIYIHIVSSDLANRDAQPITHVKLDLIFSIVDVKEHIITYNELEYVVVTESNSTISTPTFNDTAKTLQFTVAGTDGTVGYCNVSIPMNFMWGEWTVRLGDQQILPPQLQITEDAANTYIHFTYEHSEQDVEISSTEAIPEFSGLMGILLIFALLTIVFVAFARKPKVTTRNL